MTVLVYRGWASFLSLLYPYRWLVIATHRKSTSQKMADACLNML